MMSLCLGFKVPKTYIIIHLYLFTEGVNKWTSRQVPAKKNGWKEWPAFGVICVLHPPVRASCDNIVSPQI